MTDRTSIYIGQALRRLLDDRPNEQEHQRQVTG